MKLSYCCASLLLVFVCVAPLLNVHELLVDALRYVPAYWIGSGFAYWCWFYSVHLLPSMEAMNLIKFEDCFEDKSDQRFILVLPKGGIALGFGLTLEIAKICGVKIGAGIMESSTWPPPPLIPPNYDAEVILGVYFWEDMMKNDDFPCVVMTRDPFERFISMYKYARDGGESGLIPHEKAMSRMKSVEERVNYTWRYFGRGMMEYIHEETMKALKRDNCIQLRVDDFFKGGKSFDDASERLLDGLKVRETAKLRLRKAFKVYDISEEKEKHSHVSGRNLEEGEEALARQIVQNHPIIYNFLQEERKDLGY